MGLKHQWRTAESTRFSRVLSLIQETERVGSWPTRLGRCLFVTVAVGASADLTTWLVATPATVIHSRDLSWALETAGLLVLPVVASLLPVSGIWLACGAVLGGATANLAAAFLWNLVGHHARFGAAGVPDYIDFPGGSSGNVADLAIYAGVAAGILVLLTAVAEHAGTWARRRASRRRSG